MICAVKLWRRLCVYPDEHMINFINTLLMLGGLVAAAAVAMMCGVCLVVWVAGGKQVSRK